MHRKMTVYLGNGPASQMSTLTIGWCVQLRCQKLLATYSIQAVILQSPSIVVDTIDNLDQLSSGGMPYKLHHALLNPDHQSNSIEDNFVEGQDEQVSSEKTHERVLNWTDAPFWPGLHNDVKKWVKGCANCVT